MLTAYELSARATSLARHVLQEQSAGMTDTGFVLECYAAAINLDHGSAVLDHELGVLRAVHGQLAMRSLWLLSAVVVSSVDDVCAFATEARRLQNPELHCRALACINPEVPIQIVECAVVALFRRNGIPDPKQPDLRDWWCGVQNEGFGRVGLKDWQGNDVDWPDGIEFDYPHFVCSHRDHIIREHQLWFGIVHQRFGAKHIKGQGATFNKPFEIFY